MHHGPVVNRAAYSIAGHPIPRSLSPQNCQNEVRPKSNYPKEMNVRLQNPPRTASSVAVNHGADQHLNLTGWCPFL